MAPNNNSSGKSSSSNEAPAGQHGVKGVYYGGDWLDIEDCPGLWDTTNIPPSCDGCEAKNHCPRSKSRNNSSSSNNCYFDVVLIGAGCIGAAIARELSRYSNVSTLWVECADDVSQGATKGNSGIVHSGYDDEPGTNRSKYCWKGNQMFRQLDKELRFGYQTNGSLVLAFNDKEVETLHTLKERGRINGVQRLRIVNQQELRTMEPHVHPNTIAALYSPDAGNVIPYEYAIALAENAVDNGVELRIRREVIGIQPPPSHESTSSEEDSPHQQNFTVTLRHWEPKAYVNAIKKKTSQQDSSLPVVPLLLMAVGILLMTIGVGLHFNFLDESIVFKSKSLSITVLILILIPIGFRVVASPPSSKTATTTIAEMVTQAEPAVGTEGYRVQVNDMLKGGTGWITSVNGVTVGTETVYAKYVINCAGGYADEISRMIGDDSFRIQPRLGDYLLLNRNQGHLAKHTLFPCPDPVLGKGVLVQTTLWGNLILGPTARDTYKVESRDMSDASVQEYILSKCKQLVPSFDPKETIHAFCGARAKSDRGDWIIEPSSKNSRFINVAGIDSPGLAGSPAIAVDVIALLQNADLVLTPNPNFNPNRFPIIIPKVGMKGLKMGPVGKNDSIDANDEATMASNVICKCEKVTELEVVRAVRRSLPIDSSQAIRKRTRAGMGHCQADPDNYSCEARVRAIIARENGVPISHVGGRPWSGTSTLPQRWLSEEDKLQLQKRMGN